MQINRRIFYYTALDNHRLNYYIPKISNNQLFLLNFYKECMENNDNSLLSVLGKLTGLFKNERDPDKNARNNDLQNKEKNENLKKSEKNYEKNKAFATDDFIKKHNALANKIKDKNS